jgi:hypothetical protein
MISPAPYWEAVIRGDRRIGESIRVASGYAYSPNLSAFAHGGASARQLTRSKLNIGPSSGHRCDEIAPSHEASHAAQSGESLLDQGEH